MHQCDKFFIRFETITHTTCYSSLNMAFKGKIHEKCRQQQQKQQQQQRQQKRALEVRAS